jgi:tetratricopeptide (TPR) repeat protein
MGRHSRSRDEWDRQEARLRSRWPAIAAAVIIAGIASAAMAADAPPSAEQPFSDTPDSREADQLFEQLLKDPKNIDLTFRYAQAAIKSGNIEGGISSLERLLLLDRNFPGVKIQLAELYASIKSYDVAKSYLAQARDEPGVTPQTLERIQAVQKQIEQASSQTGVSSNVLAGIRYQTNASAEPAGSDIVAGGVPQTLSSIFLHKGAWDVFATGNAAYTTTVADIPIESSAIAYYSKSLGHSELDLGAIEVNSGPRFDINIAGTEYVSLRPYAVANEVMLGESQFLHSAGAGLGLSRSITETLSGSMFYEFRSDWFDSVVLQPAGRTMSGDVHSFGASLGYRVIENGDLSFQASYALTDDVAIGSNKGLVLHLGYSQLINLPAEVHVGPLNLSPFIYWIYSHDDSPDVTVSPTTIDWTNEWRYGITAKLGLTDNIATTFHVVHQVAMSNIDANKTRDTQFIVGVALAY